MNLQQQSIAFIEPTESWPQSKQHENSKSLILQMILNQKVFFKFAASFLDDWQRAFLKKKNHSKKSADFNLHSSSIESLKIPKIPKNAIFLNLREKLISSSCQIA